VDLHELAGNELMRTRVQRTKNIRTLKKRGLAQTYVEEISRIWAGVIIASHEVKKNEKTRLEIVFDRKKWILMGGCAWEGRACSSIS